MIIVLKPDATEAMIEHVMDRVRELGLIPHLSKGQERTIIGVIGDDRILANQPLRAIAGVEDVVVILAPWKLAGREFKKDNTIIDVCGVKIGGKQLAIMAGPCAVEKKELTVGIAQEVKAAGANILRGGAYKPRSSPYAFQGLGNEGLDFLGQRRSSQACRSSVKFWIPATSSCSSKRRTSFRSAPATCRTLSFSRKWAGTTSRCC